MSETVDYLNKQLIAALEKRIEVGNDYAAALQMQIALLEQLVGIHKPSDDASAPPPPGSVT